MDGKYQRVHSEPGLKKPQTGLFSYLFFFWLNGILKLGYQRPLTDDDLLELSDENKAHDLVAKLHDAWMEEINSAEKRGKKPRLWKAMCKVFLGDVILNTSLKLVDEAMKISLVLSVWFYLKFLKEGSHVNQTYAVGTVIIIGVASVIKVFSYHHCDYLAFLLGLKLKSAVIGLVHKKITDSKRSDISKFTTGHIMNLVSNDAKRMDELALGLSETITIPIGIVAVIVLLSLLVGWQSLSCLPLMLVLVIINLLLTQVYSNVRREQAKATDKRLAATSEIIIGIRAVKMFAWEWEYKDRLDALRRKEMQRNKQKTTLRSVMYVIEYTFTAMTSLVSIVTLVWSGISVDASKAFTLTMIAYLATRSIAGKIGNHFLIVRDSTVSIKRIEEFLYNGATSPDISARPTFSSKDAHFRMSTIDKLDEEKIWLKEMNFEPRVDVTEMSAAWRSDQKSILHQVSIVVQSNQLLIVTGPVGSGKTSLLMAILGEIPTTGEQITVHGRTAYVSQIPWIFSGSIRDNIVFGRPFDETRYNRILGMCDLQKDINSFPYGDMTVIGQRGVGLSGGQRARVNLARAVYSDADIFLLDDPLSAVDARVGQHIFDRCICGELSNRVRILVTHQVQHLPRADKIAVVTDGAVVFGTYSELREKGVIDTLQPRHGDATSEYTLQKCVPDYKNYDSTDMREENEDRVTGTVSWRLYWKFFRAGLPPIAIGCLVSFLIFAQASLVVPSWWLSRMVHMTLQQQKGFSSIGVLAILVGTSFTLSLASNLGFVCAILRSTRRLHDQMALAVVKYPVLFFDTNPAGRIMNRFSKDVGAMDDLLPIQFIYAVSVCLNVIVVVLLALAVNMWIAVAVIPLMMLFFSITSYYLKSFRELKRIEAIRCSPVYDHVGDTITGLEVIRTSGMEKECCNKLLRLQDEHTKAFFLVMATARWVGLYVDLLCAFFLVGVAIAGMLVIQDHGLAGMLLSLSFTLFGNTQYGIRQATEVESQMTSVERVMRYTELPPEPGYSRQDKPPADWPSQGSLSIRDLSMVYFQGGPSVLRDVNLDVQPKEKIGIVGRTGAGKSSLVAALFRMPDPIQGQVFIDGVDLGTIDIQAVRRSMAVITQDPVLFAGRLRKNLDPFNRFTDQAIWTAIDEVQLMKKVSELDGQLYYCVGEGGSGFSVGERQLLCLARALLQKCMMLVLDEATANVDYKTDQLIQQVIRQKFTNCTVLTIAHRVNTIMDYDKVVVLDQGHVVEYGDPRVLREAHNGFFSRLIMGHGECEKF